MKAGDDRCRVYLIYLYILHAFSLHDKVLGSLFHCGLPPGITMYKIQRAIIWKSRMSVQNIWKMIMPVSPFLALALYRAGVKISIFIYIYTHIRIMESFKFSIWNIHPYQVPSLTALQILEKQFIYHSLSAPLMVPIPSKPCK